MEIVNPDVLVRWLKVMLGCGLLWIVLAAIVQIFSMLRGSSRRLALIPAWVRVAVLGVVSSVAVPKSAQAAPPVSATTDEPKDSRDFGAADGLLAGSIAANAGFAAIHVRRHLARVRRHKFSIAENCAQDQTTVFAAESFDSPDWSVVVRVLGPPLVMTSDGQRISFDKGKALELLVWMSEHRDVSTRSAARTALWDGAVKDATFSNVVSEVRRSLNSGHPDQLEDWIPRTFTDDLPLHHGVVTDAQLLEVATKNFERDRDRFATDLVRQLTEVRNLPFSGADYGWADGEGITTSHVIKVVRAAVLVGEYAIEQGDDELLFMATERGLRVLPGHEQLVSLRMRGHARRGNRSAIKYEWESYARAVEADSWAGAEPSRELEELARELSRGVV